MRSSTFFCVTLPFLFVGIRAANAPPTGFRDYYDNIHKRDPSDMMGHNYAIMPLTRGVGNRLKSRSRRDLESGDANLTATDKDYLNFLVEVAFGNQTFLLVMDTGSSDTWVPSANVTCFDPNGTAVSQPTCAFGKFYNDVEALTPIPGIIMNQSYDSGEFIEGPMFLMQVTVGGLTINQTQVSVVDSAFWEGDSVNSGLIGLGPANNTAAVSTSSGDYVAYNPVLTTLFKSNTTSPFFSMAIDKVDSGPAGFLAIGGLPPVAYSDQFTTVPIEQPFGNFTEYIINVTGFSVSNVAINNACANNIQMIVDSGTTVNVVPTTLAYQINNMFNPPGIYNETLDAIQVDCNATAPTVSIQIGNGTFVIDPASQFFQTGEAGVCTTGWTDGGEEDSEFIPFVLGDVFLNNVVAVFDQGTLEMHFAARTNVGIGSTQSSGSTRVSAKASLSGFQHTYVPMFLAMLFLWYSI